MKKLLLAALALATFSACTKDRLDPEKIKRPTSVTTIGPVINQKLELKYETSGNLNQLTYFNNDQVIGKVDYKYQGNLPVEAIIISSLTGPAEQTVAEVFFGYNGQRLVKVGLEAKVPFVMEAATHEFHSDSEPQALSHPYLLGMIGYSVPSGTIHSLVKMPTYSYEFDTHKNPFYDLPIIGAVVGNNAMSSLPRPIFVFEGVTYFQKNNVVLRKLEITPGVFINTRMEYTYDSQGYPTKIKTYSADGSTVFSETVIKY